MQQKMNEEGKLYEVDKTASEETYEVETFSTTAFELVLKSKKGEDNAAERLLEKLSKVNDMGQLVVPKEEHENRKMEFIQKRMTAIISNASGADFEQSKKALCKAIFNGDN
jgi:hypothetical protein